MFSRPGDLKRKRSLRPARKTIAEKKQGEIQGGGCTNRGEEKGK